MSNEIKIQTTAPDELAGGQAPLTERKGNESEVNQLSFCRGTNVESGSAEVSARDGQNKLGVTGRAQENARSVDARNIEGSHKGDTRNRPGDVAAASLNRAADNGGPRKPRGQFPNNGKTPQGSEFQSFSAENGD